MKKLMNLFLYILTFVYVIFEAVVWDYLIAPIYRKIKSYKIIDNYKEYIEYKANRYFVLIIFLSTFAFAEGAGLYAGKLFTTGMIFTGLIVYLTKIPIGVIAFATLKVGKFKLNSFSWFKIAYDFTEDKLEKIKKSKYYQTIIEKIKDIKSKYFRKRGYLIKLVKRLYLKAKQGLK